MAILNQCPKCEKFISRKYEKCPKCKIEMKKAKKWKVNLPLPNGRRVVRIIDTKLTDAKDVEAKLRHEKKQGLWFDQSTAPLVHDVAKKLHKYNERRLKRPVTHPWDKHIKPHVPKKLTMDKWTTQDIQKIINRAFDKGLAPATVRQILVVIKRLYNWSRKQGIYIGANPADSIDSIKVHNQVTRYLDKEQIAQLKYTLKHWRNKRGALFIKFAMLTGCRQGELFNLQWDDVSLTNKEIYLRDPKGKPCSLPISKGATRVLKRVKRIKPHYKKYVFCNRFGKKRNSFSHIWTRVRTKAKLPSDFRFHDLRHNFATHLASSGKVSLFDLQKLLNHSEIKMTMRYAHHLDSSLRRSVDNIDRII